MWWATERERTCAEGHRDLGDKVQESGGESGEHQRPRKEIGSGEAEQHGSQAETNGEGQASSSSATNPLPMSHCQDHLMSRRWTCSSSWTLHVLTSVLSLFAFTLLLVMVFSKKWLHLSGSRFYRRWPANVKARIRTKAHIMSMGLIYICRAKSCNPEHWKENFKQWTNQPFYGVAKINFCLALGLGFALTIWLHLPYLPGLQRLSSFGWIATIMSFCEVTFIFFTLMFFPINLWIFEWKRNLSIPIGWSYFIGWLVFFLYVVCALCYFNQNNFWGLVLMRPSGTVSCSSVGFSEDSEGEHTDSKQPPGIPDHKIEGVFCPPI